MEKSNKKSTASAKNKIRVTLVRSTIGSKPKHRKTIRALGLRRISSTAIHQASQPIMGMIKSVIHLVKCEEISK